VTQAADLLPTLRKALDDDGVSIVVAPVDYAENINLTDHLGALTDPL
jgi:acetolactate synthase-1/2/3 large subunit